VVHQLAKQRIPFQGEHCENANCGRSLETTGRPVTRVERAGLRCKDIRHANYIYIIRARQPVGSVSIRSGDILRLRDRKGDRETECDGLRDTYREPVSDGVLSLRLRLFPLVLLRLASSSLLLPEPRLLLLVLLFRPS